MKRVDKLIFVVFAAVLIFCMNVTAYAVPLSSGSVQGLPEKLVVLDENGQSASENGEYFFIVENMQAGLTYTKNIQLMNLRDDASYKISFRAEPLTKSGEIDLENECSCEISIDGETVYSGKVTGEGTPDIRDNALSLGNFEPGESHVMKVDVKWNGTSAGGFIDNGERIVDTGGTTVIREKSGQNEISGETTFQWSFYAQVEDTHITELSEPDPPSDSGSGTESSYLRTSSDDGGSEIYPKPSGGGTIIDFVQTGEVVAWTAIIIIMTAALILIILLASKKKKQRSDS